jgi:hypothetical protein
MKRHAWRVTIGAAALGAVLLAVLVVANWSTVRDHIEAWRFQLTTEKETIEPFERGVTTDEEHRGAADNFVVDPASPNVVITEQQAIGRVRQVLEDADAEYSARLVNGEWSVLVWFVTSRDADGTARFVPGGFSIITFDQLGNVTSVSAGE